MKKLLNKLAIAVMGLAMFVGCTTAPIDTANKKELAVALSVGQIVDTLSLWYKDGIIDRSELEKAQTTVKEYRDTIQALQAAKALGDVATAEDQAAKAAAILQALRNYVANKEGLQ